MIGSSDSTVFRWLVVAAVTVGLFGIRLSFIQLFEFADEIPTQVEDLLRLVPPAVLAALVVPDLVFVEGRFLLGPGNERLIAGTLALVAAWWTEDILRTLVVGMGALWVLKFVV